MNIGTLNINIAIETRNYVCIRIVCRYASLIGQLSSLAGAGIELYG